jgi:hypothetical protein
MAAATPWLAAVQRMTGSLTYNRPGGIFAPMRFTRQVMHKYTKTIIALAFGLALSGCASFRSTPVGATLDQVTARYGKPDAVYPDPDGGQMLEYRGQPMGQFQHMAKMSADGHLVSYEQVLTTQNFARIQVAQWNKDDVLRKFGRPAEISRDRKTGFEVWSYRYKQDGIWPAFMNVYLNGRGEVARTDNSPDPVLDDRSKGM